jgi:hypothetical protein
MERVRPRDTRATMRSWSGRHDGSLLARKRTVCTGSLRGSAARCCTRCTLFTPRHPLPPPLRDDALLVVPPRRATLARKRTVCTGSLRGSAARCCTRCTLFANAHPPPRRLSDDALHCGAHHFGTHNTLPLRAGSGYRERTECPPLREGGGRVLSPPSSVIDSKAPRERGKKGCPEGSDLCERCSQHAQEAARRRCVARERRPSMPSAAPSAVAAGAPAAGAACAPRPGPR